MYHSKARPGSPRREKGAACRTGAIVLAAGGSGRIGYNMLMAPFA